MADVFISHSTKDKEIADLICDTLESNGIKCWIAPRDIEPGADWSAKITEAIHGARVFIIVYSENSVASSQVPREVTVAGSSGAVIIPYRIDGAKLTPSFEYYLMSSHWVNADAAGRDFKLDELYHAVESAVSKNGDNGGDKGFIQPDTSEINTRNYSVRSNARKRSVRRLAAAAGVILGAVVISLIITACVIFISGRVGSPGASGTGFEGRTNAPDASSAYVLSPAGKMPIQSFETIIFNENTLNSFEDNTYSGYAFYKDGYIGLDNHEGYTSLNFTAFLNQNAEADASLLVQVDGSDRELVELKLGEKELCECEIDITGAKTVSIFAFGGGGGGVIAAVKNMYFSKNGEAPESFDVAARLAPDIARCPQDKIPYATGYVVIANNSVQGVNIDGGTENSGFAFHPDGYIIFDNCEGYKNLKFNIASLNTNEADFYVETDGEIIYGGSAGRAPQTLEFDVTGSKKIIIASANNEKLDYTMQCLFVYGAVLSK